MHLTHLCAYIHECMQYRSAKIVNIEVSKTWTHKYQKNSRGHPCYLHVVHCRWTDVRRRNNGTTFDVGLTSQQNSTAPPSTATLRSSWKSLVIFQTSKSTGFAFVSRFAPPKYPDHDPLTVEIDLQGEPVESPNMLYLDQIDPARIMFMVNRERSCMNVTMRVEGIDVSPDLRF